MDNHASHRLHDEHTASLHTYLHDHVAGAEHAVHMLRALKQSQANTSVGVFAGDLLHEVEEDLTTLKTLASNVGAGSSRVKEAAGWLADKLSHLKLSPLNNPFHTFEALELVSLGILGKRALWKALALIASTNPKLHATNFNHLVDRAEAQYEAVEAARLQLADLAFAHLRNSLEVSTP